MCGQILTRTTIQQRMGIQEVYGCTALYSSFGLVNTNRYLHQRCKTFRRRRSAAMRLHAELRCLILVSGNSTPAIRNEAALPATAPLPWARGGHCHR